MEKIVNERIKTLRKSLGLTQKEFADKLNVKQATISAIENGKAGCSIQLLNKICEVYKIDMTYFFVKNDDKENFFENVKKELIKFQGILIGKLGEKTWKELEPYFPKCKQAICGSFK